MPSDALSWLSAMWVCRFSLTQQDGPSSDIPKGGIWLNVKHARVYCIRSFARCTPRDRSEGAVADIQISAHRASCSWLQSARRSFYSGNGPIGQWTFEETEAFQAIAVNNKAWGRCSFRLSSLWSNSAGEKKRQWRIRHGPSSKGEQRKRKRSRLQNGCGVCGGIRGKGRRESKSHSLRATEERPRVWEICIFVCLLGITEIKKEIGKNTRMKLRS